MSIMCHGPKQRRGSSCTEFIFMLFSGKMMFVINKLMSCFGADSLAPPPPPQASTETEAGPATSGSATS